MRNESLSPQSRRNRVYREMDPNLRKTAAIVHARLRRANLRDLLTRHSIGRIVKEICLHPEIFGQNAGQELADFLGIPGGGATLVGMENFSDEYTEDFIIEQAREPMANGDFVSYAHFRELMRIKDRNVQRQFVNRVREEGLTLYQLRREIAAYQR
jgi:hypothetical protein